MLKNTFKFLEEIYIKFPHLKKLVHLFFINGLRCYIVGGAVRDFFIGRPIEDIDIEVHGINIDELYILVSSTFEVVKAGKVFGVLKCVDYNIDISVPRKDLAGRKPQVIFDKNLTIEQALIRRDLTINAIAIEITLQGAVLHDPYGGIIDLEKKILRAVNNKSFVEDPLRLFRVMRYKAILLMNPDDELTQLCLKMSVDCISRERIINEVEKMLLYSSIPSQGFFWLKKIKKLFTLSLIFENMNEDLFVLSMNTLDYIAKITCEDKKLMYMYLGLTMFISSQDVRVFFRDFFAKTHVVLQKKFFNIHKIMHDFEKDIIDDKNNSYTLKKYSYIAEKHQCALYDILYMIEIKYIVMGKDTRSIDLYKNIALKENVLYKAEASILSGYDILELAVSPDKRSGLLSNAYMIQIMYGIKNKNKLIQEALKKYY